MASRIPLIVNTTSAQLQELPVGDDLNLAGSNIANVNIMTTTSGIFWANGVAYNSLTGSSVSTGKALYMNLVFGG
jgi:hypothetical protein